MEKDEAEFDRYQYVGRARPNKIAQSTPLKSDFKSERQGYYYREEYAWGRAVPWGRAVVRPLQLKASGPEPRSPSIKPAESFPPPEHPGTLNASSFSPSTPHGAEQLCPNTSKITSSHTADPTRIG